MFLIASQESLQTGNPQPSYKQIRTIRTQKSYRPKHNHETNMPTPSQQLVSESRSMPSSSQIRGPGARGIGASNKSEAQPRSSKSLGTSLNYRIPTSGKTRLPQRDGNGAPAGLGKGLAMRKRHRKVCSVFLGSGDQILTVREDYER